MFNLLEKTCTIFAFLIYISYYSNLFILITDSNLFILITNINLFIWITLFLIKHSKTELLIRGNNLHDIALYSQTTELLLKLIEHAHHEGNKLWKNKKHCTIIIIFQQL